MPQKNKKDLEKEAVKELKSIYLDFLNKVKKIEAERDKKIMAIIKRIEERKIEKIRRSLND